MATTTDLAGLQTESRNSKSADIDNVSTLELCHIINEEDGSIPGIVKGCIPTIVQAIDALASRVRQGGRVICVGAGTSGRLGVLDASEIPPTYSAPPAQFVGLIAGGDVALRSAKEGAEDSWQGAVDDLSQLDLDGDKDSLIGIASSGRTPYVLGCLAFAKKKGCITIGIACSAPSAMSESGHVNFMIEAVTGAEVVAGSTRMKAGTATKLILNMLSTGTMIKIGKTFGNIMVDVRPTNVKLQLRARKILREICGDRAPTFDEELDRELSSCGRNVKLAAVKIYLGISVDEADSRLRAAGGVLANIITIGQTPAEAVNRVALDANAEYVLCVDGGGSKCSAVLLSRSGLLFRGESGPCNPTDVGIQGAVSAIRLAIQRAIDSLNHHHDIRTLRVHEMWIGLAGGDREAIAGPIRAEIEKLLDPKASAALSITNDIDLLAAVSGHEHGADDIVVLVAGTGSIAMRYVRGGTGFHRVVRAGGWGALLGDDGSGFEIGRKAIRAVLLQIEERMYKSHSDAKTQDPLVHVVCQEFQTTQTKLEDSNLLNNILLSADGTEQTISQTKRKIAGCAKAVIATQETSERAQSIVLEAVESLVRLIRTVLEAPVPNGGKSMLALAGGLMSSSSVVDLLVSELERVNLKHKISGIKTVGNPAELGARFLAQKAWKSNDLAADST